MPVGTGLAPSPYVHGFGCAFICGTPTLPGIVGNPKLRKRDFSVNGRLPRWQSCCLILSLPALAETAEEVKTPECRIHLSLTDCRTVSCGVWYLSLRGSTYGNGSSCWTGVCPPLTRIVSVSTGRIFSAEYCTSDLSAPCLAGTDRPIWKVPFANASSIGISTGKTCASASSLEISH